MVRSRHGTPSNTRQNLTTSTPSRNTRSAAARQLQFELDTTGSEPAAASGGAGPVGLPPDQLEAIARRVAALLQPDPPARPPPAGPDSTPGPTASPPTSMAAPPPLVIDPPREFNEQWCEYLSQQRLVNDNFQTRDKQEIRTLLLATSHHHHEPQDYLFLQDRLKLFVIVGHRGWAAALTALPDLELMQLGVPLPPPAPVIHLPQPAPPQYAQAPAPGSRRRRRKRQTAASAAGAD